MKNKTKVYFVLISSTILPLLILLDINYVSFPIVSSQQLSFIQSSNDNANENSSQIAAESGNNTSTTNTINHNTNYSSNNLVLLDFDPAQFTYSLGDKVSIDGFVTNVTGIAANKNTTKMGVSNIGVIIEATQDDKTIYRSLVKTDAEGKFSWFFYPPSDGIIKVSARLSNFQDRNQLLPEEVISIVITKPLFSSIIIIVLIIIAFAVLLVFPRFFPIYHQYSIIFAAVPIVIGYIVLYRFPPFDSAGNIAIATALFSPIAAYLVELLKKEKEARTSLETNVSKYRDEHLKNEVQSIRKIHEEITKHESIFSAKIDLGDKELPKSAYNNSEVTTVGTIANLPALRIEKYYYYVDSYNEFLRFKLYLKSVNHLRYGEFDKVFQDLKNLYSRVNEIIYANLTYDEGELHQKFLSFPSVNFPPRMSTPLLKRLTDLRMVKGQWKPNTKVYNNIYNQEKVYDLMRQLGTEFGTAYCALEEKIKEIHSLIGEIKNIPKRNEK